jgi:acyl-CoA synthetase (AMP-forming)/AMP-acid ligase II
VNTTLPVPPERAALYRAEGLWDDRTVADGIEAAAAFSPDTVAVMDNERSLTYRELAVHVDYAASRLRNRGRGPGSSALLVTGNTIDGVVAYHALLRTGTTIIALDRRCGPADVRLAVATGGERLLVICPASEAGRLLADLEVDELALDDLVDKTPVAATAVAAEPDRYAPALVLFTSGTTGRPKGVIHTLNTLSAGARNMASITRTGPGTVVFLVSPLTSIAGIMQMHCCADNHATFVLEDHFEAESTLDRINDLGAHLLGGAPVIVQRLLHAAANHDDRLIALRTVALGGAMLPLPLLEQATDEFGIEIVRVYGSSEAPNTTGSLLEDDRATRLADDGAFMPGTEVRVGSREHRNEGLLRGPALFLGYVDPRDNDSAFEEGWFRTGDAVEVDDGRLTVIGRLKDVVNRNGLKIALTEIDQALTSLPGVSECASFAVVDDHTGERLAVAVRPKAGVEADLEDVIEHLQAGGLATRKLPEQLVVWDDPLPRTASGKIVRPRLVRESVGKPEQLAHRLREA